MTVKQASRNCGAVGVAPAPGARNAAVHATIALAVLTNVCVAVVPLATPLLGTIGAVAAIVVGCQHWQSRLRWMPLVLFVAAVVTSLVVDLRDLADSAAISAPLSP